MPIAKIQLDDGRVARFEVPDGTTPEQAMQFAADHFSQKGNAAPTRGGLQDATNTLESAYTFGLNHDLAGAARALKPLAQGAQDQAFSGAAAIAERLGLPKPQYEAQPRQSIGDAYRSGRDESIARMEGFKDRNPVTGFALDVAGGLANPLMQAAGPVPGASLARQTGQGLALGAGAGGAYGLNTTQGDIGDRAGGAVQGAAIGGAVGAAAPGVIQGLSRGAQWAADQTIRRVMPTAQNDVAARKVAEALVRDGLTPQQAAARLAQMGPEAVLADLGANSQSLAGTISRAPGQGRQAITDFVTARQEGVRDAGNVLSGSQIQRIMGQIDGLIPNEAEKISKGAAARRMAAGANYEASRADPVNNLVDLSPMLKNLDNEIGSAKGGIKSGLQKIRDLLVDSEGRPEITIDALHSAKMAIDDLMSSGDARNSMGRVAQARIKDYQSQLLSAIENSGEAGAQYAAGRGATSAAWRTQEALDSGMAFMNRAEFGNPREIAQSLAKMTPEDQHAFRVGAAQAIKGKLDALNVRSDATKRVMDVPALEDKIRAAFGDQETFRRYIDALRNERQMFNTYGEVTGNSKTAARTAADADLRNDPGGMAEAAMGIAANPMNPMNYVRAGVNAVRGAQARLGTPEPARDRMAQLLISRDANALQPNMQAVQMNEARRAALARALLGGVAANQ